MDETFFVCEKCLVVFDLSDAAARAASRVSWVEHLPLCADPRSYGLNPIRMTSEEFLRRAHAVADLKRGPLVLP